MISIKVLVVGKPKESWIEEGVAEYVRRLSAVAALETVWVNDDAQLLKLVHKERLAVGLDIEAPRFSSQGFASWMQAKLIQSGSRLTFVIGGADGLPAELKSAAFDRISLSPLTFTHQLARLLLAEQIYRAFEIARGSPYPR